MRGWIPHGCGATIWWTGLELQSRNATFTGMNYDFGYASTKCTSERRKRVVSVSALCISIIIAVSRDYRWLWNRHTFISGRTARL